jgi:cyclopropane fatty-acyl-phospholipid synthase-like methyltransferase
MTDRFADHAADYDTRPLPQQLSEGIIAAIAARVPLQESDIVHDFGAGTGLLTGRIAPKVGAVIAVDVSPAMLAHLAAKSELQEKVEPVCQNLLETPLGRRVTRIVSAMAMHHVEDTPRLLATLYQHLEPGGQVALADLEREDGDFHPPGVEGVHHHGFDREELAAAMQTAGFERVEIETACTVEREGKRYGVFLATPVRPAALLAGEFPA